MAYEIPLVRSATGNTIKVSHPKNPNEFVTFLSSSVSAAGTTLTVQDNNGFSENNFVVIGQLGVDRTEIKRITAAVSVGTSLTVDALSYDHAVDAPVLKTLWDQVEISSATSATGSKTVVATIGLQADRTETVYVNTGVVTTVTHYFARYKNSNSSVFSEYSDPAPVAGFSASSVRAVKDAALGMIHETVSDDDDGLIPDSFLNQEVFNCEQETWSSKLRWSWAYTFDSILGNTTEGQFSVSLPSTISDSNSNKGVLTVRIAGRPNLTYVTKEEFDLFYRDVRHTTTSASVATSDTTITLTDSSDFDSSGSITIESDSIDYTGNTESTGTLTGVTNITATHASGDDVWQNVSFGEPTHYTVWGGKMYFNVPISSTYAGLNIYLSYYNKPTSINSDNDTVNIPDYTLYHYYIAWKVLLRKADGKVTPESEAMRQMFDRRLALLSYRDRTGQRTVFKPRLNTITYQSSGSITVTTSNPQA